MVDRFRNAFLVRSFGAVCMGLALAAWAAPAAASDGLAPSPGRSDQPTHYEELIDAEALPLSIAPSPGVPDRLHVVEASARVEYHASASRPDATQWELRVRDFSRRHERIDAVYDMILVLPLPASSAGDDGFVVDGEGVELREGTPERSTPAYYDGDQVVLKRNRGLEEALLPGLIGSPDDPGKLPALDGTGYRYTFWDAVVRYDPGHGESVQGWASLRYATGPQVEAPESSDPRLSGWWITWIPSLPASVPPYTVRFDVTEPTP